MPIYEYQCQACGEVSEILQKVNDAPATECPSCHKPELKKMLSASAFHLKGSGWYVTDFKNKPQATNKDQPENKSDSSTKTEEKPKDTATKETDKKTSPKTEKKAKNTD